jgi:hypothetical protein
VFWTKTMKEWVPQPQVLPLLDFSITLLAVLVASLVALLGL